MAAAREKVGVVYGLGTCQLEFRVRGPSSDVLLGTGATTSDAELMRMRDTDRFAEDERASVLAIGRGARGDVSKRFEWFFRRSFEITDCKGDGGGFATRLDLAEAATRELRIEVRGKELFRSAGDDAAPLSFQPYADADADADGDGSITLEELSKAPYSVTTGAVVGIAPTLEKIVYEGLLPRLVRVAGGGPCETEERRPWR